jgi:hypothetical protein
LGEASFFQFHSFAAFSNRAKAGWKSVVGDLGLIDDILSQTTGRSHHLIV